MNFWNEFWFQTIILLSNIIQIIAGFAGNMIAIPLSVDLIEFSDMKMVLNTFSTVGCIILAIQTRKDIDKKEFTKMTFGMFGGMLIGWGIVSLVATDFLLPIYAGFIICVGIYKLLVKRKFELPKVLLNGIILLAGIIHGMFLSGGSMLAIYAMAALKDKKAFRATLNGMWVITGVIWLVYDAVIGNFTTINIYRSLVGIATLAVSVPLGNLLFKKIDQERFAKVVYILIIIAGLTIFF